MSELSSAPVALVTGGAGGVGRAVVRALVDVGFDVVATDIAPAVKELSSDTGASRTVVGVRADASEPASAAMCFDVVRERFGRLDVLVNNAGRFLRKSVQDSTVDDFDRLFATNVRGAFMHTQLALPLLAETRGAIVNVASSSGLVGVALQSIYAMTKGALVQLTRQLAIELAPTGIRVNAVAPGAIDTEFTAEARAADPHPDASAAASLARHPSGRYSEPEEVAEAIVFLASARASGVSGAILSVDGGYVAQ